MHPSRAIGPCAGGDSSTKDRIELCGHISGCCSDVFEACGVDANFTQVLLVSVAPIVWNAQAIKMRQSAEYLFATDGGC